LRRGGQTKQLEMAVTVLPNEKNEQLHFVTLDFTTLKGCSNLERSCSFKGHVSRTDARN